MTEERATVDWIASIAVAGLVWVAFELVVGPVLVSFLSRSMIDRRYSMSRLTCRSKAWSGWIFT